MNAPLPRSVLSVASSHVPVATPDDTVDEVLARLRRGGFADLVAVAVCEHGRTVGLLGLTTLLTSPSGTAVRDVMDPDPPTAHRDTDQEVAAWNMVRHGHTALLVLDDGGLVGMVTPAQMMEVLLYEHEEDLSRLAGVVHDTSQVRSATVESVRRRVVHRIPWLLVGLVGATLAAVIVAGYEQQLSTNVMLAFFLPGVVYMADAVGTQTETVVVRGLSVGVPIRLVAPKEAVTGLIIGALVAVLSIPLGLVVFHDLQVILAVALALFASAGIASVVAMGLPALLDRLGSDPAYGSGPLSTVIQDLLTVLCYFAVVTAVV